jgi:hypothetical protein
LWFVEKVFVVVVWCVVWCLDKMELGENRDMELRV